MSKETRLREGLLALEPLDPEMHQRLEQQIRDLADGRLSKGARLYWWLFLAGCVLQALFLGWNVIWMPKQGLLFAAIASGFAASVLCGGLIVHILVRGRVNIHRQIVAGRLLPAVGLLLVFLSFLYGMEDPSHKPGAVWFGLYALAALVFTSNINLWNRIVAADLHTQEHMLRLEYRLVELVKRMELCGTFSSTSAHPRQPG